MTEHDAAEECVLDWLRRFRVEPSPVMLRGIIVAVRLAESPLDWFAVLSDILVSEGLATPAAAEFQRSRYEAERPEFERLDGDADRLTASEFLNEGIAALGVSVPRDVRFDIVVRLAGAPREDWFHELHDVLVDEDLMEPIPQIEGRPLPSEYGNE